MFHAVDSVSCSDKIDVDSEQLSGEADQRIDTGDNMYACSVGKVSRKNELALVCNTLIIAGLMAKEVRVDNVVRVWHNVTQPQSAKGKAP